MPTTALIVFSRGTGGKFRLAQRSAATHGEFKVLANTTGFPFAKFMNGFLHALSIARYEVLPISSQFELFRLSFLKDWSKTYTCFRFTKF